ncbi:MAG: hypothetical protein ACO38E_10300 [Ilumatobacteraceae bacterium]
MVRLRRGADVRAVACRYHDVACGHNGNSCPSATWRDAKSEHEVSLRCLRGRAKAHDGSRRRSPASETLLGRHGYRRSNLRVTGL